ncbi:MAG: hypothetical protein PHC75_06135 [Burkholderiales bacterium]|nr:hypothetical protein [Burkholderiales bacterium]
MRVINGTSHQVKVGEYHQNGEKPVNNNSELDTALHGINKNPIIEDESNLFRDGIAEFNFGIDSYQPTLEGDKKSTYTDEELQNICNEYSKKICNSFTQLLLGVQLQNIESGSELLSIMDDIQKIIADVMADFAKYLMNNADATVATAVAYLDSMKQKYVQQALAIAETMIKTAGIEIAIAVVELAIGAYMLSTVPALAAIPIAGPFIAAAMVVAALSMITKALFSMSNAVVKMSAALELQQNPEKGCPTSDEYDPALVDRAQNGLAATMPGFVIAMTTLTHISSIASLGLNVNTLITVIGWAFQIAEQFAVNDENKDSDTGKALHYLANLSAGIAGIINIAVEALAKEVIIPKTVDKDDETGKMIAELVLMAMKMAISLVSGYLMFKVASNKSSSENGATKTEQSMKVLYGRNILSVGLAKNDLKASNALQMILKSNLLLQIITSLNEVGQNINTGLYQLKEAGFTFDREMLTIKNDLAIELRELENKIIKIRKEQIDDEQDKVMERVLELVKSLQDMLNVVNTGIQHTGY